MLHGGIGVHFRCQRKDSVFGDWQAAELWSRANENSSSAYSSPRDEYGHVEMSTKSKQDQQKGIAGLLQCVIAASVTRPQSNSLVTAER